MILNSKEITENTIAQLRLKRKPDNLRKEKHSI